MKNNGIQSKGKAQIINVFHLHMTELWGSLFEES